MSGTVPVMLYGDPAIQFYASTMLPAHLLHFPKSATRLYSALTIRWGYHNGTTSQVQAAVAALLPLVLQDCATLALS